MKLFIWIVILILVVAWIMRNKQQASQGAAMESRAPGHQGKPEGMLPCSHCGIYIPASEALPHTSGAVYCCDEHRRQAGPGT